MKLFSITKDMARKPACLPIYQCDCATGVCADGRRHSGTAVIAKSALENMDK